jgi:hypothetical protein
VPESTALVLDSIECIGYGLRARLATFAESSSASLPEHFHVLPADQQFLLLEAFLQRMAIGIPPLSIHLPRHHLEDDNVVALGARAILPEAVRRCARVGGQAPEARGQPLPFIGIRLRRESPAVVGFAGWRRPGTFKKAKSFRSDSKYSSTSVPKRNSASVSLPPDVEQMLVS